MNRKDRRAGEARLRHEDARRAEAVAATPVGAAMKAVLDSLTTPDKEDWTILVDGEDLRLSCFREDAGNAEGMHVWTTVADFMAGGPKGSIETAPLDGLGCVTSILPTDAEERGALDVLCWMQSIARKRGFKLLTVIGTVPTREAVRAWEEMAMRQAQSAGEA
jgi:hypothetical protein